jgi:hypothetical protein
MSAVSISRSHVANRQALVATILVLAAGARRVP